MRKKLEESGIEDVEIDSAGIGAWHTGQLPDARMRACGARHGYEFAHRARQVKETDFCNFDLIVGMDSQNMKDLKARRPADGGVARLECMADYLSRHEGEKSIPDPYYGDERDFEYALELIEDAAEGLIEKIKEQGLKERCK